MKLSSHLPYRFKLIKTGIEQLEKIVLNVWRIMYFTTHLQFRIRNKLFARGSFAGKCFISGGNIDRSSAACHEIRVCGCSRR